MHDTSSTLAILWMVSYLILSMLQVVGSSHLDDEILAVGNPEDGEILDVETFLDSGVIAFGVCR